jgi:hypothetical protein
VFRNVRAKLFCKRPLSTIFAWKGLNAIKNGCEVTIAPRQQVRCQILWF